MARPVTLALAAAILTATLTDASAQHAQFPSPWTNLRAGQRLALCHDAPDIAAARRGIANLHHQIAPLHPETDPRAAREALRELLSGPCFALAWTQANVLPEVDSARSLQQWWRTGGESWIESYLNAAEPNGAFTVVVPASARREYARDEHGDEAIAPLLCPRADATCGQGTRGWIERANTALAAIDAEAARRTDEGQRDPANRRPTAASCGTRASHANEADRFRVFAACIEQTATAGTVMPLGAFEPPAHGWLVVRGRRGHYRFCDELRLYSLETGAAWIASSCSGLVLAHNGDVDGAQTDAARNLQIVTGRLPVDNLREAALIALLRRTTRRVERIETMHARLPRGIEATAVYDATSASGSASGSAWGSSAQTQLAIEWIDSNRTRVHDTTTWPDSSDAIEMYFDELLRIAEGGLVEGCAPSALPASLPADHPLPGVSSIDASRASVTAAHDALWEALASARSRACRPARSR